MTTIHIDSKTHAVLKRLRKEKRKRNMDDVINMLLVEHEILSQKPIEAKPQIEDETLKCINRIFCNGFYWCVVKPPKAIKLLTLDICKVCKARKLGLSDSTRIEKEVKEAQNRQWLFDKNRDLSKYGMVYCPNGGLWVFPSKCDSCNNYDCPEKKKRKMEKERELYGQ